MPPVSPGSTRTEIETRARGGVQGAVLRFRDPPSAPEGAHVGNAGRVPARPGGRRVAGVEADEAIRAGRVVAHADPPETRTRLPRMRWRLPAEPRVVRGFRDLEARGSVFQPLIAQRSAPRTQPRRGSAPGSADRRTRASRRRSARNSLYLYRSLAAWSRG